jgi:hypothetical protein
MVNSIVIIYETSFDDLLSCDEQISPQKVKDVVKCMHLRASKGDSVFKGDYTLSEDGQVKHMGPCLRILWHYPSLANISFSYLYADRNGTSISRT